MTVVMIVVAALTLSALVAFSYARGWWSMKSRAE